MLMDMLPSCILIGLLFICIGGIIGLMDGIGLIDGMAGIERSGIGLVVALLLNSVEADSIETDSIEVGWVWAMAVAIASVGPLI